MRRFGLALLTAAFAALPAAASAAPSQAAPSRALRVAATPSPTLKLPVVLIDAPAGIVDDPKRSATMRVFDRQSREDYSGPIGIEVRGNWSQRAPKKSFGLETRDYSGTKRPASLLGMPSDGDWVLIANYIDESLLRNLVAYSAARWMGYYASRAQLVEVRVNNSYEGVYLLAERLEIGGDRIAVDHSDASGGYLLELTNTERAKAGQFFTTPAQSLPVVYAHPKRHKLDSARARWIQDYVSQLESALYGAQFTDPEFGYRQYLDVDAAVDFVLLNELFRNADTFRNSTYMHKGVGGKLVLGPLWDFDHALGNDPDPDFRALGGWQYQTRSNYRWVDQFYADPAFRRAMAARWRELQGQGLIRYITWAIDVGARQLSGGPQERNFARWPIFGTPEAGPDDPRTGAAPASHAQAVDYLKWWVVERANWMTRNLNRVR